MNETLPQSDFAGSANFITRNIHNFLRSIDVPEQWISFLNMLIVLAAAILIVYFLQKLVNYILNFVFKKMEKITGLTLFKYARDNRVPYYLALIVPYTFVVNAIPVIFIEYQGVINPLVKLVHILMVFIVISMIMAVIRSFMDLLQRRPAFKGKPIKSYLQVIQILFSLFGLVIVYCIITGSSPTAFFAAMGAASAVLMLMFKDTIMGFVSSIQISTNNMVHVGDWITVNKYGADGTVEEIALTTVKVRNFDNTITTIPTYVLISDSFQNWRGMQESGGRRLKRSIIIKQADICILSDDELESYMEVQGLATYITKKKKEYADLNTKLNISSTKILKGFAITNCDLFLCYATLYLKHHPQIRQDMSLMVRELSPTVTGLPIEVYAFTNTIASGDYEQISGEIINHLLCRVKDFGLRIYESSSGSDSLTVNLHQRDQD